MNSYERVSPKRIGIILQARMGSRRLPGKVMLSVQGKPVLQHIIDRLKDCERVDDIILATTTNKKDDCLANLAENNDVEVFRGSEEDVLSRYYYAAVKYRLGIIIRITGDCPFIDPEIIDRMVLCFLELPKVDFLSNTIQRTFPKGLDVEIMNFSALEKAFNSAREPYHREHVTPYISQQPEEFLLQNYSIPEDYSGYRLTLDTTEDYMVTKRIYERLYPENAAFRLRDIIKLLQNERARY